MPNEQIEEQKQAPVNIVLEVQDAIFSTDLIIRHIENNIIIKEEQDNG